MSRYRVTTPDTQRAPGKSYADFEQACETESIVCVRHLLEHHNFAGCTVRQKGRRHWGLIFDSSLFGEMTPEALAAWWGRIEADQ